MEKIYSMHKLVGLQLFWSRTPNFSSGTPTFCQMGVLNSCFQNSSESSVLDYSLHNDTLENVQSVKYLGITITDNMDWGQHVSEISSKATKSLGFLCRNLAFAPRSTK